MATLDQLLTLINAQDTQLDSIRTLIAGLRQQVAEALATDVALSVEAQAKIDQIFAKAEANSAEIGLALSANVPVLP